MDEASREPLPGVREVAKYLNYKTTQTIYDQRYRGYGIGTLGFRVGKSLKFRWEEIDAFIKAQSTAKPSDDA